jgi:hypothetical protein
MYRSLLSWQAVLALAGLLACPAHAQQTGLTCQVRCSDTKLRTGIAEISWSSPAGATAARAQPTLDVSVFHDGFKRGLYQSFGALGARSKPEPLPSAARDIEGEARTRRAYDLQLRVSKPSGEAAPAAKGVVRQQIEIENLEPGLLYRFRVRDGGLGEQEVACEAPICPADMKEGK